MENNKEKDYYYYNFNNNFGDIYNIYNLLQ